SIIDVTDDRAAQRDLQMLGRAVESSPDIVSFHDASGAMFFANSTAREFFGIPPNAPVPPLGPSDYIDAPSEVLEGIAHELLTTGHGAGELDAIGAGGRRLPLSVGVVAHHDENGVIEYFSSICRDLTEQRGQESARRRSEAILRAIVQSSPLAIFALDA